MLTEKNISRFLFLVGILTLIISFVFKDAKLSFLGGIRPIGLATVIICPTLGIIGLLCARSQRDYAFMFLNFLLIISFFIIMSIGYRFGGA